MADRSVSSTVGGSLGSQLSGTVGTNVTGSFGAVGPVTIGGIPSSYSFAVTQLPKIDIGLPTLQVGPLQSTLKIEPVQASLAITAIPSVRVHLPANYALTFSLFGMEVAAIALCGEGQIITEPYRPNACEVCDGARRAIDSVTVDKSIEERLIAEREREERARREAEMAKG